MPLTDDGCRELSVTTPAGIVTLRTYYSELASVWRCDIIDGAGATLLSGLSLVAGTPNLLKGMGVALLEGYSLEVVTSAMQDAERDSQVWESGLALLVLWLPGETARTQTGDPMVG
jgi:hypothetical protein